MGVLTAELQSLAAGVGIQIEDNEAALLVRYLSAVYDENCVTNLTRIAYGRDAVVLHLIDSLLPFATAESSDLMGARFIDIGSGGGFPGVPMIVHARGTGMLLDSVAKKMNSVQRALASAGLDGQISTVADRAEVFALENSCMFDIVTARAMAPLESLLEYAQPLLKSQGRLISFKAELDEDEFELGCQVARALGFEIVSRETFYLPMEYGNRCILIFEKVGESSYKLPRRNGMARKKPLSKVLKLAS